MAIPISSVTLTETEGLFPSHIPSACTIKDIRSDRQGVSLLANITIKNKNSTLISVMIPQLKHKFFLGKFAGRTTGEISLSLETRTFIFVISRAFEVQTSLALL